MANNSNSTGRKREGGVWKHNPAGRKGYWKSFISRQLRRQDKIIARKLHPGKQTGN